VQGYHLFIAAHFGKHTWHGQEVIMLRRIVATPNDPVLLILRLVLGVIFFAHGAQKVLGWWGGYGFSVTMHAFTHQMNIPAPLAATAIAAEFLGGIGLIVGFLSRIAALGILVNMAVAIVMVHNHFGLFMNWYGNQKGEGIEYHLLAIAIAAAIVAKGSGALSVDQALAKGPAKSTP
jgi:putative oxidoreductase